MVGWKRNESIGHFTSGGTIANFEGLLRAKNRLYQWLSMGAFLKERGLTHRTLFEVSHMGWEEFDRCLARVNFEEFAEWKKNWLANPIRFANHVSRIFQVNFEGPVVLVSQSKHYSWPKGTQLLGMGNDRLISINLDRHGRMDVDHFRQTVQKCRELHLPISTIVTVAGTTEMGTVDPIDNICLEVDHLKAEGLHLWHHVDAAYGGFLCSMIGMKGDHDMEDLLSKLGAIRHTNSVTIDPHKLGYVPYASGVILVRNRREYAYQEIHAPYIQFDPAKDVGLQTLEGSRSAAGAVATWLTERSIGLNAEGYGRILARTISVRKLIQKMITDVDSRFRIPKGLDTNVLCLSIAESGMDLSQANQRVRHIYAQMAPGTKAQFILSMTTLRFNNYECLLQNFTKKANITCDSDEVDLLRLCLMNPFIVSKETNISFPDALVQELLRFLTISAR
jgi:glutamate/tyrosine decarboxylase-like PLP-dependent enzyme